MLYHSIEPKFQTGFCLFLKLLKIQSWKMMSECISKSHWDFKVGQEGKKGDPIDSRKLIMDWIFIKSSGSEMNWWIDLKYVLKEDRIPWQLVRKGEVLSSGWCLGFCSEQLFGIMLFIHYYILFFKHFKVNCHHQCWCGPLQSLNLGLRGLWSG